MQQLVELLEKIRSATPSDDMVASFNLKPTDRIVGTLPDELKRFCAVCLDARSELNELHAEFQVRLAEIGTPQVDNEEQRREVYRHYCIGHEHLRAMETYFWSEVRCAFPETIKEGGLAIREDWQLVIITTADQCCMCGKCFSSVYDYSNMSFVNLELLGLQM